MYNNVLPVRIKLVFSKSTTITGPKWSLNMRGWWMLSSSQLSASHQHLVTTGESENTTGNKKGYLVTRKTTCTWIVHVAWSSKVLTLASIPTGLLVKLRFLNLSTNCVCIYMYMYLSVTIHLTFHLCYAWVRIVPVSWHRREPRRSDRWTRGSQTWADGDETRGSCHCCAALLCGSLPTCNQYTHMQLHVHVHLYHTYEAGF